MFCPNCGSNVPDTERFCPTCGTAMGGENAAPAAPEAPKNDVVSLIKSKLPVIIGAVVAVVAVVFLWNLIFGGSAAAKYVKAGLTGDINKAGKCMGIKMEELYAEFADQAGMSEDDFYEKAGYDDYKDMCAELKEDVDDSLSDAYGSNWKVKTKEIGSTTDLEDSEEDAIEAYLEGLEEAKLIDDAGDYDKFKKVWVLVTYTGEDGKEYDVEEVLMYKKGLSWKVAEFPSVID